MKSDSTLYITDIMIFEAHVAKNKPIFVNGRNFYSLSYRHKGKISISWDEEELISAEDCVTFVPKNVSYTTEVLEDTHMTVIHFDITSTKYANTPKVINVTDPYIRKLFLSLTKKETHFSQLSAVYNLLSELSNNTLCTSAKVVPEKIAKAKELIDICFSDYSFSVEGVAEKIKISSAYLRREFHSAYGISPIKYLKDVRITAAKRLLLSESCSVSEIAKRCGYTSASYFIQDFHKLVGESPNQYRQKLSVTP